MRISVSTIQSGGVFPLIKKITGLAAHFRGAGIKAQMLRGVGGSAIVRVINMILALGTGIILARLLGPKEYGQYSFILSIIMIISLPTRAGLPTLLTREVAKYVQAKNWSLLKGLARASNIFVLLYAMLATLCSYFLAPIFIDDSLLTVFYISLTLIPLIGFEQVRMGMLRGFRYITKAQLPEQVIKPAVILICLGSLGFLATKEVNTETALTINIIASAIAFLLGLFFLLQAYPKGLISTTVAYDYSAWSYSLVPLSLFAGIRLIDSQIAILFLGVLSTDENVGLFKVAVTGASLIAFGLTAVNMALAPQIARLYHDGELQKLQRLLTLCVRGVMLVTLPVAVIFTLFGDVLISFLFGKEFVSSTTALTILVIGQVINCGVGSVALVLNMIGHERKTVLSAVVAIILNAFFSYILIPQYGINGAAFGYVLSLASWNLLLLFLVKKHSGLNTSIFVRN